VTKRRYQEHYSIYFTIRIFRKGNPHQIKADVLFFEGRPSNGQCGVNGIGPKLFCAEPEEKDEKDTLDQERSEAELFEGDRGFGF